MIGVTLDRVLGRNANLWPLLEPNLEYFIGCDEFDPNEGSIRDYVEVWLQNRVGDPIRVIEIEPCINRFGYDLRVWFDRDKTDARADV